MEEKKLSEQESLELISQMIRSTRKNMEVGSGNQFLYWGYFTAALSVLLFLLVYYTGDARWSIGWFSMFLFWGFMLRMQRKETPSVITYTDRAILQVWKVIGSLFVLTVVTVLALPINILAGLLGMNVGGIPLADSEHGFWVIVGILVVFTAVAGWLALRGTRDK